MITLFKPEQVMEEKQGYTDHDRLFKQLIQTFFREFMEAFFPQIYESIHFSIVSFREQEVFTDIIIGEKCRIDILAEVEWNKESQIILVHIELQASYQKEFHERMFIYCSRLYEKHRKPILPIAVFSYTDKKEVPAMFTMNVPSLEVLKFQYLQLHLVTKNWRAFIKKDNPAAAALLSKMGYTKNERVQVKVEFLRMVSRLELNPAKTELIYGFFETYLKLNEREEEQVRDEIEQLPEEEANRVFRLPNSYFEKGVEKGRKEGMEQGRQEGIEKGLEKAAKKMLTKNMPIADIVDVTGLKKEDVEKMGKN